MFFAQGLFGPGIGKSSPRIPRCRLRFHDPRIRRGSRAVSHLGRQNCYRKSADEELSKTQFGVLESRHSLLRRRVQGGISTNQAHLWLDHRYIYTQKL